MKRSCSFVTPCWLVAVYLSAVRIRTGPRLNYSYFISTKHKIQTWREEEPEVTSLRCKRKTDGCLSEIEAFIKTIVVYMYNYWPKLRVNDISTVDLQDLTKTW